MPTRLDAYPGGLVDVGSTLRGRSWRQPHPAQPSSIPSSLREQTWDSPGMSEPIHHFWLVALSGRGRHISPPLKGVRSSEIADPHLDDLPCNSDLREGHKCTRAVAPDHQG